MFYIGFLALRFWQESPRQKVEKLVKQGEIRDAFIELTNLINTTTKQASTTFSAVDPFFLEMRARCAMMLSMTSTAIFDLTQLLTFRKLARVERDHLLAVRATAYLRVGDYHLAIDDSNLVSSLSIRKGIENYIKEAETLLSRNAAQQTETSISRLLSISPESPKVLSLATKFFLKEKDFVNFTKYSHLLSIHDPTNREAMAERGTFFICKADLREAIKETSTCLDENSNENINKAGEAECNELHRNALYLSRFADSVQERNIRGISSSISLAGKIANSICAAESELTNFIKLVNSSLLRSQSRLDDAYDIILEILENDPQNSDAILSKADVLFDAGDYESAAIAYKQLVDIDPSNFLAKDGLKKSEQLLERQRKMSNYKILGIAEDSNYDEVHSAFRKAALKWHPDNFRKRLLKNIAEKKMKLINSAFEQLSLRLRTREERSKQSRREEEKAKSEKAKSNPGASSSKSSSFNSKRKNDGVRFSDPEYFYRELKHPFTSKKTF